MLDICIPIHVPNLNQVITCLEAIRNNTKDTPFRVILDIDGGEAEDAEPVRQYLATSSMQRVLMRALFTHNFSGSLAECVTQCRNKFVAIIPPHIELIDPEWFGKLHRPFQQDKTCMLTGVDHDMPVRTGMPPIVLGHRGKFVSDIMLTRLSVLKEMPNLNADEEGFSQMFANRVRSIGGHTWVVPSVKLIKHDHVAHVA